MYWIERQASKIVICWKGLHNGIKQYKLAEIDGNNISFVCNNSKDATFCRRRFHDIFMRPDCRELRSTIEAIVPNKNQLTFKGI